MSEETIVGGHYGAEVDLETANALVVEESDPVETTQENSDPNGAVATEQDQTQETEQLDNAEDAPFITEVEIDGKDYSFDDIKLALDDSQNRNEWQKSNTQKAQDISEERKALEKEKQTWEGIRKDADLMDTLKDYLGDDHALFNEVEESANVVNTQDTKEPSELSVRVQELEGKLEEREATVQVERDIQALVKSHPELDGQPKAIEEVLTTAVDKGLLDLEDAFIITNHQATVDSAFSKAVKTLEEAKSAKAIPEASVKHDGDRSPSNAKPKDFDDAREMALKYDLYA